MRWVQCAVQRPNPALERFVADCRNDEQILGTCGRHIRYAHAFGAFFQQLFRLVFAQFPRRAPQQAGGAESASRVDVAVWLGGAELGGDVAEDDNRKLQTFGDVDSHQAHPISRVFKHRRFG